MSRRYKLLLIGAAAALLSAGAVAHIRLISATNGKALRWNSPSTVGLVINSTGSDDVPDDSDDMAIRLAVSEWNAVSGTTAQLIEDTTPSEQARTDWTATNIHLVLFDESNTSGFFPGGSGTVAITPILYNSLTGKILDADVLFNGSGFSFTTTQQASRFDIQDVGTHELGHLLGLDHTGTAGGTMYPYVDPTVVLHRSLSEDEVHGMRDAYPSATTASITGTVQRLAGGANVSGAFVVARDADGRTQTSMLTDSSGDFTLTGLLPGTYTVYARPLDSPVSSANLGPGFSIETDFEPAVYGGTTTITGTETVPLGVLQVDADVALTLGTNADVYPLSIEAGTSKVITVRGAGLNAGSTLTISDPNMTLGAPTWGGGSVIVQVTVPGGELPGHVDLTVTNSGGDLSILPGAIEIVPPTPVVTSVTPAQGSTLGGTPLTLGGSGFRAGARVVIGDQLYEDGVGSTTVVDANTIQLVTGATLAGTHDVVVLDPAGVEGRLLSGFASAAVPAITTVFPPAGAAAGGTTVTLTGQNFQTGIVVRIDGVNQTGVMLLDSTRLEFTTAAGTAGGPFLLEVQNLDGGIASSLFSYSAQVDPILGSLTPAKGSKAGGDMLTLSGTGFTNASTVTFGGDPATGAGGLAAASVTFVSSTSLQVVTPAFTTKGAKAVLVTEPSTGQASMLPAGFTVGANNGGGGGGGGGCYVRPLDVPPPTGPRQLLLGAWWLLALGALLGWRARLARG